MLFKLMPREEKFFVMFEEAMTIITRGAGKFLDMITKFDRLSARSNEIHFEEHACDEVIERILKTLDRSFITPIDREDIHTLATLLDDIMDNLEETAHRFQAMRIDQPTPEAIALARIIQESCLHLEHAIRLCPNMKNASKIQHHLLEIGRLENEADNIYRDAESALFASPPDLLFLIKWRDLYRLAGRDRGLCKAATHIISQIVIKGS